MCDGWLGGDVGGDSDKVARGQYPISWYRVKGTAISMYRTMQRQRAGYRSTQIELSINAEGRQGDTRGAR